MTPEQSLKTMANRTMANRYFRMIVESTSHDVIETAWRMYPDAILVKTHRGYLLAVPEPEK